MTRWLVDLLLVVAVVVQVLVCLSLVVVRDPLQRIHYGATSATVGPVAVAAAVVVRQHLAETGIKAVLVALVLIVGGAAGTHALGRAARIRPSGDRAASDSLDAVEAGEGR